MDLINASETDVGDIETGQSLMENSRENALPESREADATQQLVNQTILNLLERISVRLGTLEQKSYQKSVYDLKI